MLGTLLLTLSGILCKIIGFFYRIFLSRAIGAEGLGIYQLIFPVSTICFAITTAGLSTALSKYVAEYRSSDPSSPRRFLRICIVLSAGLSALCMAVLLYFSEPISIYILSEPRCAPLLKILAWSIPFASVHACIHGYYYGRKKTAIPAVSSVLEQSARIAFALLVYMIRQDETHPFDTSAAVWGIVIGEAAAFLFCVSALWFEPEIPFSGKKVSHPARKLITYALPLSANRLTLTLFSSFEAILIPSRLHLAGYSQSDALSIFGILTGMSLSIVLFPTVLINSIAVMILPVIAEAQSNNQPEKIRQTIRMTISGCLLFGSLCTLAFFTFGPFLGTFLFGNALAGHFIRLLSFICPFLFLSALLSSILHGLGMPGYPFVLNLCGSMIRILFVHQLIPLWGLKAYLVGMLFSQIIVSVLCIQILHKKTVDIS